MRLDLAASDRLEECRKHLSVVVRASPIIDREAFSIGRRRDRDPSTLLGFVARAREAMRKRDNARPVAAYVTALPHGNQSLLHIANKPVAAVHGGPISEDLLYVAW
jgi:hypothetical protein